MTDAAIRAFCCFGRLKFGGELEALLKLLPQKEQAKARAVLRATETSSEEDMRRSLAELLKAGEHDPYIT